MISRARKDIIISEIVMFVNIKLKLTTSRLRTTLICRSPTLYARDHEVNFHGWFNAYFIVSKL